MVVDPRLEAHLAHFGIRAAESRKTEKSMLELELDLNSRERAVWDRVQEAGQVRGGVIYVYFFERNRRRLTSRITDADAAVGPRLHRPGQPRQQVPARAVIFFASFL